MRKLIFSFFISSVVFAQSDRITQAELDSTELYRASSEAIDSFKMHLQENKDLLGWPYYYSSKGYLKYFQKQYDSVIFYQEKAIKSFQESDVKRDIDENRQLLAHFFLGKALVEKKQYKKAILNYQKSLDLSKKYPYKWKSYILGGIGGCHLELGDPKAAVKYFKDALKDSLFNTVDRETILVNTKIGVTYLEEIKNSDSAHYYLKKALNRSLGSSYKSNMTAIYFNLGRIHEKKNRVDSAMYYYKLQEQAYKNFRPTYPNVYLFVLLNKSYAQIQKAQYQKAFENLNKIKDSVNTIEKIDRNDKDLYTILLDRFILYYDKTNNHKEALKVYEEKIKFLEAFQKRILKEKINDLEIQFQSEQKDKSIEQLKEAAVMQNALLAQKNITTIALAVLLLLFFVLGGVLLRQRNLQSKYEKINLEQRLLRSQMSPHFIFNALSSITGLVNENSKKASSYILNFSSLLRLILNNSREEFVLLQDEIIALENYLTLQSDFNNTFTYSLKINDSLDRDKICVPPMLIQPFIENSIEHGITKNQKGKIDVVLSSSEDKKMIKCVIEDDGVGYTLGKERKNLIKNKYRSLSSSIVRERLDIYQKKFKVSLQFKIEDILDEFDEIIGTRVVISIPYLID